LTELTIRPIKGLPLIEPHDNLSAIILNALRDESIMLQPHDVLVVSSKIVSKSEGRFFDLASVNPSCEAQDLAQQTQKDPRIVELILQESAGISRQARGVLVAQHRLGFISANAGIDQSNVGKGDEVVLLLPQEPDQSAQSLRQAIQEATGIDVGIVISDTHGRPFRLGNVGVAIGVAGLPALLDLRGHHDLFGRELKISMQGYADLIASSAHLVCGEGDEGLPVVLVRGLDYQQTDGKASDLYRPPAQDLYR
jgi:coenzyme F420-0:L-glutamate ligase/coenzyme F420-1:gamma-L-glutamate ligase